MYPLGMTPQDPLIFALCIVVIFLEWSPYDRIFVSGTNRGPGLELVKVAFKAPPLFLISVSSQFLVPGD